MSTDLARCSNKGQATRGDEPAVLAGAAGENTLRDAVADVDAPVDPLAADSDSQFQQPAADVSFETVHGLRDVLKDLPFEPAEHLFDRVEVRAVGGQQRAFRRVRRIHRHCQPHA